MVIFVFQNDLTSEGKVHFCLFIFPTPKNHNKFLSGHKRMTFCTSKCEKGNSCSPCLSSCSNRRCSHKCFAFLFLLSVIKITGLVRRLQYLLVSHLLIWFKALKAWMTVIKMHEGVFSGMNQSSSISDGEH